MSVKEQPLTSTPPALVVPIVSPGDGERMEEERTQMTTERNHMREERMERQREQEALDEERHRLQADRQSLQTQLNEAIQVGQVWSYR